MYKMQIHRKNSSTLIDRLILSFGFVLLLLASSISNVRAKPFCYGNVDLMFVVDASYSISDQDFAIVCNFVIDLYSSILENGGGGGNLRAGVVMYASTVYEDDRLISLSDDPSTLVTRLKTAERDLSNLFTNTYEGLARMLDMFNAEGRPDSTKVAILITDDVSDDPEATLRISQTIKTDYPDIFVIAISHKNSDSILRELLVVASDREHALIQTDLTDADFLEDVQQKVCAETLDQKTDPEVDRESLAMEVVFLLPESQVLDADFQISKDFVKTIMRRFEIGNTGARVGIIKYGESVLGPAHYIDLDQYTTEASFFSALDALTLNSANSRENAVHRALERLSEWVDQTSDSSRPVAAVLLTAESAQQVELAIQQADMLKKRTDPQVYLNVIGLGTNTDAWESERNRMAHSDATSFYSESFLGLAGGSEESNTLIEEIRATISRIGRGTLDTAGPGAVVRWNNEFDIIFMLDGSEKVSSADFQINLIKFVVKELIDEFELYTEASRSGGRVGVIVYDAAGVYNMISMGDYEDRDDLLNKIDQLDFIQRTEMADNAIALEAVREYFEMLPRESAAKLAYMIAWSTSGYPLLAKAEAQVIAQDGIQLMIIGVGDGVSQDELNSLQLFDGGNGPVVFTSLFSLASTESLDKLRADLEQYAAINRPTGNVFRWDVDFDFIVMLHDESGRENNGIAVRNFLQSIFSRHDIGPDDVRVGVITFGADVNTGSSEQITLGQSSYLGGLVIDVFQLPLIPTGGPNVEAAVDEMREMFNMYGRNGVPKVALLITQGISLPDSLDAKIADVKDAGIKLMSIGIGPETESLFLQQIASNDELAFAQPSWPAIEWTTEMDAGLVALAMDMFQPQGPGENLRLPTQCGQKAAIIFVIDASPSISSIFDNVKAFVAALMSGFELPTVQIGTVGFATSVIENSVVLPGEANSYIELYLLFEERMLIDDDGFSTNTDLAIERMTQIFSMIDGTYEKIGVVVTDGKSSNTDATVQAGNSARQAGIDIIAIGVGDQVVETELVGLTGDEALYFAFVDNDFTDSVKLQSVQEKICILSRSGECGPGNFRDADFACQSCPLKTYQPEAEELFCEACPSNTTTLLPGAQRASDCIRNCAPGTRINGAECEDCPIGQYQNESAQQTCKTCPPDRNTTPFLGATSIDQCAAGLCNVDMDLIFVVDGSSSIGTQEFALVKAFLVGQLTKFTISPTQTRIGIVPIGSVTRPEDVFGLDQLDSESEVTQAILALQGGSTSTNTASAISIARQELDQNSRDGIPKVILVITDEISEQPGQISFEAVLAREKGYVMMALGLGTNVFERELNDIAPGQVYYEENYLRLPTLDLSPEICSAARQYVAPEPDQTGECSKRLELIIVMDLSESTRSVFLLKAGLVELLDIFDSISPETVRIGVFAYGESVHIDRVNILSGNDTAVTEKIIAQFKEGDFESDTAEALEYARELLIESRPDVAQVVMIVTNGASDNFADTVAKAAELRERRIYTLAVDFASGNPFETGLKAIGTAGSESVVLFDPAPIPTVFTERLKSELCIENFVCSFRHDLVYIWDVLENSALAEEVARLTAELSKSFSMTTTSLLRVGQGGSPSLETAINRASDIMLADPAPDTVLNLVIITDKDLPSDITTLRSAATAAKAGGVRIIVVTGDNTVEGQWAEIASSAKNVFPLYFLESSHLAWFICKEPCESGYEIKEDGVCDKCEVGFYRDATKSHQCVTCDGTTTTIDSGATSPSQCILSICEVPMDLIFLIDASESIGLRSFGLLKAYLWNLIDKFPVGLGDEQTRVAHVTIGQMVTDDSYSLLTESTDALTVQTRILRIIGDEPRTNTGDSIRYMAKIFRDEGRANVPKVSVVITDGRSVNTFQTKKQIAQARLQGVGMVSVGVGDTIFIEEINAIASTPDDVFIFRTFNDLFDFNELHVHLCEVAKNYKPPDTVDPVDPLSGDCSTRMDLIFMLDASTDVSAADFTSMQAFIVNLIDRLDIGLDKIRVGILAYSNVVHLEIFPLDSSNNRLSVSNGVFSQSQTGIPGRNTVSALGAMINMFDSATERNGVSRVAVLMKRGQTGGLSDLENRAIEAKNEGIHVIPIGFGDQSEAMKDELESISTDADTVLHVARFSDLEIDDVIQLACAANFECPVPMEIYMIWDLSDIETIIRAERFIEMLDKEFTETIITSVFIDHVDNVAEGVVEGLDKLLESQRTQNTRSLLIITDKELTVDTKAQLQDVADRAKSAGILTIVVDAHSVPNGLDSIASSRKMSFTTDMFDVLPTSTLIKQALCTAPCPSGTTLSITSSGFTCENCPADSYRDASESFTCTPCPNGETSDPGSTSRDDCSVGVCSTPMDIVYVIDASESILDFEFNALLRAFLYNTMLQYDIGIHRIGLVPFSKDVFLSQVFDLDSSVSKDAVLTAVNSLTQEDIGLGTNTAKAIDTARDMLLTQGRREVMWSIVVITDGVSDNRFRTSEAARKAREDFIRVIGLGVGNRVFEPEIRAIASQDSSLIINSFTSLALTYDFVEYTCEDSYMCGKDMDILVLEENAPFDLVFTVKLFDFNNKLRASYASTIDSVGFNLFDLESKIDSLALPRFVSSPAKTKVFLFITISDISLESSIEKINSLRQNGGIVALVKANTALDNRNFVQIVSNSGLLFEARNFNVNPYLRHIERQLCIDPCTDGNERNVDGDCVACSIGYRRVASETSKCVQCPDGETTVSEGSVDSSACIPDCGPGTFTVGNRCEDCAIGEYQPDKFQSSCITCPNGLTTVTNKSTSIKDCVVSCEPGTRRSIDGLTCIDCPKDFYQPKAQQTFCEPCPVNLKTTGTKSTSLESCQGDCSLKMDVIFLVDASTSVSLVDYQLVKAFIVNTISRFVVSQTDTRFGIITFARDVILDPMLELEESIDRDSAIDTAYILIQGLESGTNMHAALSAASDMFASQGLPGRPRRVVLITDGIADNRELTEQEASRLKSEYVHITCIGVGPRAFLPLLRNIATNPDEVIYENSFAALASKNILSNICGETCPITMDVYFVSNLNGNQLLENRLNAFRADMSAKFPNSTIYEPVTGSSLVTVLSQLESTLQTNVNNSSATKSVVIVTNQQNTEGPSVLTVVDRIKDLGYVIAVIYLSADKSDLSYNSIVSDKDLLFFAPEFDVSPYSEYILRTVCIPPCGDGTERNRLGLCSDCERGTYRSSTEQHICEPCPTGQTTNNVGTVFPSDCIDCEPENWLCADGVTCIPLTQLCDSNDDCVDGSDEICNDCEIGTFWDEVSSVCVVCPKGTYQDTREQTSCEQCPPGSSTPGTRTTSLAGCNITCDQSGEALDPTGTRCVPCDIGYYRDIAQHPVCNRCPDGFTTVDIRSTSEQDCVPNCVEGEAYINNQCEECPPNTYQPEKYQTSCEICPDGTTSPAGSASCTDPCPAGQQYNYVSLSCENCQQDTFATDEMIKCRPCPFSFITIGPGSTNIDACFPDCGAGSYWNIALETCSTCNMGSYQPFPNRTECFACPIGKITELERSDSLSDCIVPCDLGEEVVLLNGNCKPCDIGYYRDDPSNISCSRCDLGWTTESEGSVSVEACIPVCPSGSRREGKQCVPCERGTYQTQTGQVSCVPCPVGLTTQTTGTNQEDLCLDLCPAGSELTNKDPLNCTLCPINMYRQKNVDNMCVECELSFITLSQGAKKKDECLPDCKAGESWDSSFGRCEKCSLGSFQPLPNQFQCAACPTGWTTENMGKTSFIDCLPDCNSGRRWDSVALRCVDCGLGQYQPLPYQTSCIQCPSGTTTSTTTATQESDCTDPCPGGQELPDGQTSSTDCVECPPNTYKDPSLDTECQACPPGFITQDSGSTLMSDCLPNCEEGSSYDTVLRQCVACPEGAYQDLKYQYECKPCEPDGFITLIPGATSSSLCVSPCLAGYEWSGNRCEPCEIGKYQDEPNQQSCKMCPPGQTTTSLQSDRIDDCIDTGCLTTQFECEDGQCIPISERCDGRDDCTDLSDEADDLCIQCPAGQRVAGTGCIVCPVGTYQNMPNKDFCIPCPNGQYTDLAGSTLETDCKECQAGYQFIPGNTDPKCRPCPVNQYREPGSASCSVCPPGFVTITTGTLSLSGCLPNCSPGTYYDGNACVDCPIGQYQDLLYSRQCKPCPDSETTAQEGTVTENDCIACPAGYDFTQGDTTCRQCPLNYYKSDGDTRCVICGDGFVTESAASTLPTDCKPDCEPGFYYPDINLTVCNKCPKGQYQPEPIQDSCIFCDPGLTTLDEGAHTIDLCIDVCPSGTEWNDITGECDSCPTGSYKERGRESTCQDCDNGFTTSSPRAPSKDYCVPNCVEGQFWDGISCRLCPPGFYQDLKYQTRCLRCPAGTFVAAIGTTSRFECQDLCPEGEELLPDNQGSFVCRPCPIGEVKVAPQSVCTECQPGFTTSDAGSIVCVPDCRPGLYWAGQGCQACPKGTYQGEFYQESCRPCPPGRYTRETASIDVNQCIDICPSGTELQFDGTCRECLMNYYRTQGQDPLCKSCPGQFFTRTEGSVSINECLPPCLAGTYWDTTQSRCSPCPEGSYQDRDYQRQCKACGAGLTSLDTTRTTMITGATSQSQCYADCKEGEMVMSGSGSDLCESCPKGTYQDKKYQDTCIPCLEGLTTVGTGSRMSSDCFDPCESGRTYNPNTEQCDPCGFSRYRDRTMDRLCRDCEDGFITLTDTASQCIPNPCLPSQQFDGTSCFPLICNVGTFFNQNTLRCTDCPPGTYQDEVNQRACKMCPTGTTSSSRSTQSSDCIDPCPSGSELPPTGLTDADCILCEKGWYKKKGETIVCVLCSPGRTTRTAGSSQAEDCIPDCKAGSQINNRNDGCDVCELATYQPEDLQTDCIECEEGLTTDQTGSAESSDCIDICNSGFELQPDKKSCMECPKGKYREKGVNSMCEECDSGFTTETIASATRDSCVRDCKKGEGFNTSLGQCEKCPIGFYQPNPYNENCIACPSWKTTSDIGADDAVKCIDPCTSGTYRDSTGECQPCPRGSYRVQDVHSTCQNCRSSFTTLSTGTAAESGCVPNCGPGTHWSEVFQSCVSCEPNTFNKVPYQFECQPCPAEYPINEDDFLDCRKECPPGETWNRERKACNWCDKGQYRPQADPDVCTPCPNDTTTLTAGKASLADCIPDCSPGQYWQTVSRSCVACEPGTIQTAFRPHNETMCNPCPGTTTYQPMSGQTSCLNCPAGQMATLSKRSCKSMCGAGQYWNEAADGCRSCPQTTYQSTAGYQESCQNCPRGSHTAGTGSTSVDDCKPNWCPPGQEHDGRNSCYACRRGFYSSAYNESCQPCPEGMTTFSQSSTSSTDCFGCSVGELLVRTSKSFRCSKCQRGTYQDKVIHSDIQCKLCPSGKETKATGSTSLADCQSDWCPSGKEIELSTGTCVPCLKGYYRKRGVDSICQQCLPGYTTAGPGATSVNECILDWCGAGMELRDGSCFACPKGFYKPAVTTSTNCTACPNGTTTLVTGSSDISQCTDPCPDGHQYVSGYGCGICGYGLYKDSDVSVVCLSCPTGTTTERLGACSVSECIVPHCHSCVDLLILVDDSNSANATEIANVREFLIDLVHLFHISPNEARIGVIRYGTTVTDIIHITQGTTHTAVGQAIMNNLVASSESEANTAAALGRALHIVMHQCRSESMKNVLLITDETLTNPTEAVSQADQLKALDVTITVIGVNDTDVSSLASSSSNFFPIENYQTLPLLVDVLPSVC